MTRKPRTLASLWPDAYSCRYEGKCDSCKRPGLWSFKLRRDMAKLPTEWAKRLDREFKEQCGYYCMSCGFSNAGARDIVG